MPIRDTDVLVELLPCPFCGERPYHSTQNGKFRADEAGYWRQVWCDKCQAVGPEKETETEAISAWNNRASILPPTTSAGDGELECHGLDTPERVCFYEQDFYVLSNFSSFMICWEGLWFPTSEHLYHWLKFATSPDGRSADYEAAVEVAKARSAHEAFKIAEGNRARRRPDWDDVKVGFMRDILRAKAAQHEYVRRKLLATGDRELVENSWRDDFWGWGPNRDGQNMLGKLWVEVRDELRAALNPSPTEQE